MSTTAPGGQVTANFHLIPHQYIIVYKTRWKFAIKGTQAQQAKQFVNARISDLGLSKEAVKHRYYSILQVFAAKLTDKQTIDGTKERSAGKIYRTRPKIQGISGW